MKSERYQPVALPNVGMEAMRTMQVGDVRLFDNSRGAVDCRSASSNTSRLDGRKYKIRTMALVDPSTCLSDRVLVITRVE